MNEHMIMLSDANRIIKRFPGVDEETFEEIKKALKKASVEVPYAYSAFGYGVDYVDIKYVLKILDYLNERECNDENICD